MYNIKKIVKTKQKQQSIVKVLLWVVMFLVLVLIIMKVTGPNTAQSNSAQTEMKIQSIEQQTQDLNADTQELESSLDQLRFEDDIRALRNE